MNWKVGEKVKYKLSDGDKICLVKKSTPSSGGHYVELLVEDTEEIIYSAYDKNLESLDK